jgi:sugar lactone lactonase YvrE
MTIDGGARPLASNVSEADWSPDGSALAVIRLERGSPRLEYPIGQVLHRRAGGYLSDVRVSPVGDLVAFFDHDIPGDDRGSVRVVDRRGAVRTVAGPYSALQGLAWSPDGRSVYFSGSGAEDDSYEPQVADVGGRPAARQLMASAGGMLVLDVARDGRLLGVRADTGSGIRVLVPGEASEREMRWLNMPIGGYLSPDGRSLLFTDQHRSAGPNYAVALHAIDTDKVVRLGEGLAGGFSPDGQWATGWVPSSGDMMLYPVGAGEPVKLVRAPLERYNMPAQWFPDGRRVLVCGNEPSKPPRCYEQGVPSGAPKPVTPEGVLLAVIAHDGRTLLMYTTARTAQTLVIGAGAPQSATAITATDRVVAWTGDDRGVVVWRPGVPVRLERVDLATGARSLLKELGPPSLGGVTLVAPAEWRDDPRSYVYTYRTDLSKLFVISGVTR